MELRSIYRPYAIVKRPSPSNCPPACGFTLVQDSATNVFIERLSSQCNEPRFNPKKELKRLSAFSFGFAACCCCFPPAIKRNERLDQQAAHSHDMKPMFLSSEPITCIKRFDRIDIALAETLSYEVWFVRPSFVRFKEP
jgi:hypothetical protein